MPFEKGQSGNPAGRPRGSINRNSMLRKIIEPHKEELINKAVLMALDGNEQMLKLLLDRLLPPKPKDEPIAGINLSGDTPYDDAIEISQQLSIGAISPIEGTRLLGIIAGNMRVIEGTKLLDMAHKIEKKLKEIKH